MSEQVVGKIVVLEPERQTRRDVMFERVAGALMGGAIADALGWPTEFARKSADLDAVGLKSPITDFAAWHKRTGGRFLTRVDNIQPGDYSDDTQLTLSVARAIRADGTVDNEYFAEQELRYWLDYARGAGATVTAAARSASRARSDWRWNFFRFKRGQHDLDYRGAGANGAAMRMSPVALANASDPARAYAEAWKNAAITHGHPRGIVGAVVFVEALRRLLRGHEQSADEFIADLRRWVRVIRPPSDDSDIRYWLTRWNEGPERFEPMWAEFVAEMDSMIGRSIELRQQPLEETYRVLGCFHPATKGSGTASVAAALALFLHHGKNFERLAVTGANMLGSDTDTIGAMAGSMCGAWLGYVEIPERWAAIMADFSYLNRVAEYLTLVSMRQAMHGDLRAKVSSAPPPPMRLLDAMKRQDIQDRRPYWHPLFGVGRVIKAESQNVGLRQPRGRVVMATVQFEFGQTCKFSSFRSLKPSSEEREAGRPKQKTPQMRLDL